MEKAERYASEIVPAFNAYLYFRLGSWLSKSIAQLLYRVRLGYADEKSLSGVDPDASVVFVMNHRSNMDYILVAYLALEASRKGALWGALGIGILRDLASCGRLGGSAVISDQNSAEKKEAKVQKSFLVRAGHYRLLFVFFFCVSGSHHGE